MQNGGRPWGAPEGQHKGRRGQAAALHALPDEPALARHRLSGYRSRKQPAFPVEGDWR